MRALKLVTGYVLLGFGFLLFVGAARARSWVAFVCLAVGFLGVGWGSLRQAAFEAARSAPAPAFVAGVRTHLALAGSWAVVALLSAVHRGSGSALWTSGELAASGLLLLTFFEVRAHQRTWILLPLGVSLAASALGLLTALSSSPAPQYPLHGRWIRLPVILCLYGAVWWVLRRQRAPS